MSTLETIPPPEPATFKRRGRIVFVLVAALVVVALGPLASVAWKLIDINREALKTSQQEFQMLLATSLANDLDTHVEALCSQVTGVAQTLGAAIDRDDLVRESEVRRVLAEVTEAPIVHLRYSYSNSRGGKSISAGDLPDGFETVFRRHTEQAVVALAQADEHTEAMISDPAYGDGASSGSLLVVAAPVFSDGRFRGVLAALVDMRSVWASILRRTSTGHVIYAMDRAGRVFATSDPTAMPVGADASGSALVRRFLATKEKGARETMPYTWTDPDGVERAYLGSYAGTGQEWGVFVRAPEQEVYLPVETMIDSTMTWSAGALLLAIVTAFLLARTLSDPINRLAEASRAFARGQFSCRVETRSRTELGELAFTFNKMAGEIEGHIRRLRRAAEENNALFLGTIRALAQAIDAKDPYTRGHSVRVNKYSVIIARELGLSEPEIRDIHVASLLHDVGKIGIHDSVLNKPGKLTDEEFELMKKHTIFGASIMQPIPQMENILPGLRWHHERWSGGGYPDGLEGEQIPLMARIIAVADTFDAITTNRPYQRTMTVREALQTVNRLKNVNLDERVVEAFFRAFRAGKIRVDKTPPHPAAPEQHSQPVSA